MKIRISSNRRVAIGMVAAIFLTMSAVSQAVWEPSRLSDPSRRWSLSAAVSSGYDDNVLTSRKDDPNKQESATTSFRPQLFLNIPMDQTFLGLRYGYEAIYYWDRPGNDEIDQSHTADLSFSHRFNPRLQFDLSDTFRRGIRPELVDIVENVPRIYQQEGNYYYNSLTANLAYNISRLWTVIVANTWEMWAVDATDTDDRDIYSPRITLNYTLNPTTTLGLNLNLGIVDYDLPGEKNARNSTSENISLTLTHMFNPKLNGQITAGGGITEFGDGQTSSSPYASGNLTYRYAANGTVSCGASYFLYTSSQYGYRSAETLASFVQFHQAITPKLMAILGANYIYSLYDNPYPPTLPTGLDSQAWRFNIGLSYAFTRWISAECHYSFDTFTSQTGFAYDRNRVWAGMRFTY